MILIYENPLPRDGEQHSCPIRKGDIPSRAAVSEGRMTFYSRLLRVSALSARSPSRRIRLVQSAVITGGDR